MSTRKCIEHLEQTIARMERSQALQKIKKRKQETRRKIELGGLVIKSGMSDFSKDIILGALIDAKEQMAADKASKQLFQRKGQVAFLDKK